MWNISEKLSDTPYTTQTDCTPAFGMQAPTQELTRGALHTWHMRNSSTATAGSFSIRRVSLAVQLSHVVGCTQCGTGSACSSLPLWPQRAHWSAVRARIRSRWAATSLATLWFHSGVQSCSGTRASWRRAASAVGSPQSAVEVSLALFVCNTCVSSSASPEESSLCSDRCVAGPRASTLSLPSSYA